MAVRRQSDFPIYAASRALTPLPLFQSDGGAFPDSLSDVRRDGAAALWGLKSTCDGGRDR